MKFITTEICIRPVKVLIILKVSTKTIPLNKQIITNKSLNLSINFISLFRSGSYHDAKNDTQFLLKPRVIPQKPFANRKIFI